MKNSEQLKDWYDSLNEETKKFGTLSWKARARLRNRIITMPFRSVDDLLEHMQMLDKYSLPLPTETIGHVKAQEDYTGE